MSERNYRIYLKDMLENMSKAEKFTENLSYDQFAQDKKTYYAVLRCIEIIGRRLNIFLKKSVKKPLKYLGKI